MLGRALLALGIAAATLGAAQPRLEQPVMVGGTEDLDACPSNARVKPLNPRGDNFLSVRSRPSPSGREIDRLRGGQDIWACEDNRDGNWTGIVYSPPGQDLDCGVGSPIARRRTYDGPCKTGWVASRYIQIIAG